MGIFYNIFFSSTAVFSYRIKFIKKQRTQPERQPTTRLKLLKALTNDDLFNTRRCDAEISNGRWDIKWPFSHFKATLGDYKWAKINNFVGGMGWINKAMGDFFLFWWREFRAREDKLFKTFYEILWLDLVWIVNELDPSFFHRNVYTVNLFLWAFFEFTLNSICLFYSGKIHSTPKQNESILKAINIF